MLPVILSFHVEQVTIITSNLDNSCVKQFWDFAESCEDRVVLVCLGSLLCPHGL